MIGEQSVRNFSDAALSPDPDLAIGALMIARLEYPKLDAGPYLDQLDVLGREARQRLADATVVPGDAPPRVDPDRYASVMALNDFLFNDLHFVGNSEHYEDPRNSCLNEVLDRRTGIPITLALLYMEVARRAGLDVQGINFPGHFLLRCPARRGPPYSEDLIIDAFHGGALLSAEACRELLRRHAGDEGALPSQSFSLATKPQILSRMLLNLKRIYEKMHRFAGARRRAHSRGRSVGVARAARPRPARLSPQGFFRAAGPAGLLCSVALRTAGRRAQRARADLGAREDAGAAGSRR